MNLLAIAISAQVRRSCGIDFPPLMWHPAVLAAEHRCGSFRTDLFNPARELADWSLR